MRDLSKFDTDDLISRATQLEEFEGFVRANYGNVWAYPYDYRAEIEEVFPSFFDAAQEEDDGNFVGWDSISDIDAELGKRS